MAISHLSSQHEFLELAIIETLGFVSTSRLPFISKSLAQSD